MARSGWKSAAAVLLIVLAACSLEGPEEERNPRSLGFLEGLEGRIGDLDGEDGDWIRDYLSGGGTLSEEINQRRLSGILGRMMHDDRPEDLAAFAKKAEEQLYDDFFHAFSDTERLALMAALAKGCEPCSIRAEKYAAVLGGRGGVFPATLNLMMQSLPLAEIAKPARMTAARIVNLARTSGEPSVLVGAAEVLADGVWVVQVDGPNDARMAMAAARTLVSEAVRKSPDDASVRMSYVLLMFQAEDLLRSDLQRICADAAEDEKENGAYPYLEALAHAAAGHDAEAIEAVRRGMRMPYVTFHDVTRARSMAAFLRTAGQGPVGSRLASYEAASVDGPMSMRRLGQLLREGSGSSGAESALLVQFPRRLAIQMKERQRLLSTELIRLNLVHGTWEWRVGENPDSEEAREVREELAVLEAGAELASGSGAWDRILASLGEKRFLRYVDEVLFGRETEFLRRCADEKSIDVCAEFLEDKQTE